VIGGEAQDRRVGEVGTPAVDVLRVLCGREYGAGGQRRQGLSSVVGGEVGEQHGGGRRVEDDVVCVEEEQVPVGGEAVEAGGQERPGGEVEHLVLDGGAGGAQDVVLGAAGAVDDRALEVDVG
jgi:hypothetical protein